MWLGHFFRMQELEPCRKLSVLKTDGPRRVGKPDQRQLESAEEDLKMMGWREELEMYVAGPRTVEGNFGRA